MGSCSTGKSDNYIIKEPNCEEFGKATSYQEITYGKNDGIIVTYKNGENCAAQTGILKSAQITLLCDEGADPTPGNPAWAVDTSDPCLGRIQVATSTGCHVANLSVLL